MKRRSWTLEQLKDAVKSSFSYRKVLAKLGLREAGGNYAHIRQYIKEYNLDASHFTGKGWNKGLKFQPRPKIPTEEMLVKNRTYQSFKLKNRLFSEELKEKHCEECGWAKETPWAKTPDGYLPLELDHVNRDRMDSWKICVSFVRIVIV